MPKKFGDVHHHIDWKEFEALCKIHCSPKEIFAFFKSKIGKKFHFRTLERYVKKNYNMTLVEAVKFFGLGGKTVLRKTIWKKATQDEDNQMLKLLAHNYLGLSDKVDVNQQIEQTQTVQIVWEGGAGAWPIDQQPDTQHSEN